MVRKKLAFLTAALLSAAMLWGCGSSGSGGTELQPQLSPDDVARAEGGNFSCTVCHSQAHTSPTAFSPLVGRLAAGENALFILHDCQDCHGGGSAHRSLGPMPHPRPDLARCAVCHSDPVDGMLTQDKHVYIDNFGQNQPNCLACHEPLKATVRQLDGSIGCIECHGTLSVAQVKAKPFANEITQRFEASPKGNPGQRANASTSNCAYCHSHQGAVVILSAGQKISSRAAFDAAVAADGILTQKRDELYPDGWTAAEALKSCATCHDPHTSKIRGLGNMTATDLGLQEPGQTATGPANRVVFSAEFNLCTSCHMVNLDVAWNKDAGYNGGGVFEYTLNEAYASATTSDVDYHAYRREPARSIADTHFKGELGEFFLGTGNVRESAGYNVNPGSPNSCTSCHDPHSGNKLDPDATGFGIGIGMTHGNFASDAFSRQQTSENCMPCHTGREFPLQTKGLASFAAADAKRWNPLGCVTCHDLTSGDIEAPRQFPSDYKFTFNDPKTVSGVTTKTTVSKDELVRARITGTAPNQITTIYDSQTCFECHKGRDGLKANHATTTQVYDVNYLHYSPSYAILFGMISDVEGGAGMIPSFADKDYHAAVGNAYHAGDARRTTCVGCHDFHTPNNNTFSSSIKTGFNCTSCHNAAPSNGITNSRSFDTLRARTKVFGDVLFEAILDEITLMYADGAFDHPDYSDLTAQNRSDIAAIVAGTNATEVEAALKTYLENPSRLGATVAQSTAVEDQKKRLKVFVTGATRATDATGSRLITNQLAVAGAIWKNFMYDDKAGWAHNSILARQIMYDAIEDLNPAKLADLRTKAGEYNVPVGTGEGGLMRNLSVGTDGTQRTLPVIE
jgi:hypothetical protein